MKRCPKCGREWPDDGNFCPMDGALLEPIAPRRPKSQRISSGGDEGPRPDGYDLPGSGASGDPHDTEPMMTAAQGDPALHETLSEETLAPPASPASPSAKGAPVSRSPEAPHRHPATKPIAPARPKPALGRRKKREKQERETRVMDVMRLPPDHASDAARVPPQRPADAGGKRAGGKRAGGKPQRFSETAWFLAAQNPEDLHDVSVDDDLDAEADRYKVDETIPEGLRQKYSLSDTVERRRDGKPRAPRASDRTPDRADERSGGRSGKKTGLDR